MKQTLLVIALSVFACSLAAQPSDADIRNILTARIDEQQQGVGIVVGLVDASGRRVLAHGN
jgi:hypothetical protein